MIVITMSIVSAILSVMYLQSRNIISKGELLAAFITFFIVSSIWILCILLMTLGVFWFIVGGYLAFHVILIHYQLIQEYDSY